MKQSDFLDIMVLAERLHQQFLETIHVALDRLDKRDINDVRALFLLNIGDSETTVNELCHRARYLGTNVSYNLGKLTEAGYITQTRSQNDRRMIMIRNSEKGLALCAVLQDVIARHLAVLNQMNDREADLHSCRQTLQSMQRLWDRASTTRRDETFATAPGPMRERPVDEDGPSRVQTRVA